MSKKRSLVRGALLLVTAAALGTAVVGSSTTASAARHGWKLPANAKEVGPDIYEIGTKQVGGDTVVGYAIIDRGHKAKPSGAGGGSGGGKTQPAYAYIASGLKWKTFGKSYVMDPTVSHWGSTPDATYVRGVVSGSIAQWEDAAGGGALGDGNSVNVLGNEVPGTVDRGAIGVTTNGVNEVCFDGIDEADVIAVTFVWGYYNGPAKFREIIEWDQIYDDDGDWVWGDVQTSGNAALMDFHDIACHEIGHAFGMDHPASQFVDETMYAFAEEGETKKRTLNAGDIQGINGLY